MNSLPPNADELVSAYLDGEASIDEINIVESTPELMTRVESLRSITSALAEPLAAPAQQKEDHIAGALLAFDELFASPALETTEPEAAPVLAAVPSAPDEPVATGQPNETVTSFEAAREKRAARKSRRFNPGILAAAAALLLLVGLTVVTGLGRGGQSEDLATSSSGAPQLSENSYAATDDAAMEDVEMEDRAGDEETDAMDVPLPSATSAADASPSRLQDEAMQDDAMASEAMAFEAMEDDAMEEASGAEEAAVDADAADSLDVDLTAEDLAKSDFFLGEFADPDDLVLRLQAFDANMIDTRYAIASQLASVRCPNVPEIVQSAQPTLIGEAVLDGVPVEVHAINGGRNTQSFAIVAIEGCELLLTFA